MFVKLKIEMIFVKIFTSAAKKVTIANLALMKRKRDESIIKYILVKFEHEVQTINGAITCSSIVDEKHKNKKCYHFDAYPLSLYSRIY